MTEQEIRAEIRTLLATQYEGNIDNRNAFGTVLAQMADGQLGPVICGHGGSMWLCAQCAQAILQYREKENETGIERYFRENDLSS
jgi:hypothetical protein